MEDWQKIEVVLKSVATHYKVKWQFITQQHKQGVKYTWAKASMQKTKRICLFLLSVQKLDNELLADVFKLKVNTVKEYLDKARVLYRECPHFKKTVQDIRENVDNKIELLNAA